MHIDKHKIDFHYELDGIHYDDAESLIQCGIFNFCGCGAPDLSLEIIRDSLQHIDDLAKFVHTKQITLEEWNYTGRRLFGSNGLEYFMYYFLDREELTEHGGSVPGWLTDKGRELLEDLNELLKEWKEI